MTPTVNPSFDTTGTKGLNTSPTPAGGHPFWVLKPLWFCLMDGNQLFRCSPPLKNPGKKLKAWSLGVSRCSRVGLEKTPRNVHNFHTKSRKGVFYVMKCFLGEFQNKFSFHRFIREIPPAFHFCSIYEQVKIYEGEMGNPDGWNMWTYLGSKC